MDVNGTEFASDVVAGALAARNESVALKTQATILRKVLDIEQNAAAELLRAMGLGQNLDVVG